MKVNMEEIKISEIIRSKRKTIALIIRDDATLVVKAPIRTTEKEFVSGESFLLLGRTYTLFITKDQDIPLKFDNAFYLDARFKESAKELFIDFYKKTARAVLEERVEYYSKLTGIKYQGIKITSANKRWGSCSKDNRLSFTYKLIMAPISIIDYVVVHELCHVVLHNHSKAFWLKVHSILPNYKEAQLWLKEKGHLLDI